MREFHIVTASTTFECRRCAKCCALDVMLSESELEELGNSADRKWRTTKKVSCGGALVCSLLDGNSCKVYGNRPKLCRVYPFMAAPVSEFVELGMRIDGTALKCVGSDGVEYVVLFDETCSGIGQGGAGNRVSVGDVVELTIAHLLEFHD